MSNPILAVIFNTRWYPLPPHPPRPRPQSESIHLYPSELCLTRQKSPGPITRQLHRSRTCCTPLRRGFLQASSSAQYSTVRQSVNLRSSCPPTQHSRGCYRPIHSMSRRVVRSGQSHEDGHQVGVRRPHCGHVLGCDDNRRDGPQQPVRLIRRGSRVSW